MPQGVHKNLISGMTSSLLESVFIPGPKSNAKELYNITLVEKLLRILYASCQYGEEICDVITLMCASRLSPLQRWRCY